MTILILALALAAMLVVCVIPSTTASPVSADRGKRDAGELGTKGSGMEAFFARFKAPDPVAEEKPAAAAQPEAVEEAVAEAPMKTVVRPPAVNEPAEPKPVDNGDAPAAQEPSVPVIATPPKAPANLTLNYDVNSHTVQLSWSAVNDHNLDRYLVKRWDESDEYMMARIFDQLADMNPAAQPYLDDATLQINLIGQGGWTWTEKMNIMAALAADRDALFGIMASTPGAGSLMNSALGQATEYRTTSTTYSNSITSANTYYVYAVVARNRNSRNRNSRNRNYEVSNPSNCKGVYAVFADSYSPARPTGVSATAYDPGVAVQWSRNTEADLAGYNVYLVQGQSATKLNQALITAGTTYFHDPGVAGAVYGVTAVDMANRESHRATATAVLAPATVYNQDNPAWQFTGQWVQEHYEETGACTLRVARDAGARASITFTGRRVKAYSAYYWSCGSARFYVDGVDYGTRGLYNTSTSYHMQPFVITGLAPGPHTLTIEVVGSGGAEGYNFVNFDSIEAR